MLRQWLASPMNQLAELSESPITDVEIAKSMASAKTIGELEDVMRKMPQCEAPVEHIFTPGLYSRKIVMYPGSLITSKIHKHRHPFVILEGECAVWDKSTGWMELKAGHMGITEPGTHRILFIRKKTVWVTFHVTQETELDKIEQHVIAKTEDECSAFLAMEAFKKLENQTKDLT